MIFEFATTHFLRSNHCLIDIRLTALLECC